ncbi:MAG: thiamine-phosphate kinase [Gammaproteobacteria bacterium]|nr:thiamine-phosphate kinase [Gammaproteobacteria bacterium]
MLAEFELIARCFDRSTGRALGVDVGIGDDGAVVSLTAGNSLVVVTDTIVAGVHFPAYTPAHAVGYRALAVNLSDIAAMGATPRWASLALALPDAEAEWVADFAAGFFMLADAYNVELIGGDTVSGPLVATVTVHGEVTAGMAALRSTASEGDAIYVTGNLGDAVAGRLSEGDTDAERYLAERFLYPTPRVHEGLSLRGIASAMIDISDGLHADLDHLLLASGLGAELRLDALPLSPQLLDTVGRDQAIEMALLGGDDYELCFTVPAGQNEIFQALVSSWECPVAHIGITVASEGQRWHDGAQQLYVVPDSGFDHFMAAVDELPEDAG